MTAKQIATQLEISERTVYRDVAALAALGAPVAGEAGLGYVLRPGAFLPPLMLTVEEVEAVQLGLRYVDQRGDDLLRAASATAMAKIDSVMSPEARAVRAMPLALPGPPENAFPGNTVPLSTLREAIRTQRSLRIAYTDERGSSTDRTVWPIAVSFMNQARVLVAWCELRSDFRMFRTDRITVGQLGARYPEPRGALLKRFEQRMAERKAAPHTPDRT